MCLLVCAENNFGLKSKGDFISKTTFFPSTECIIIIAHSKYLFSCKIKYYVKQLYYIYIATLQLLQEIKTYW